MAMTTTIATATTNTTTTTIATGMTTNKRGTGIRRPTTYSPVTLLPWNGAAKGADAAERAQAAEEGSAVHCVAAAAAIRTS